MSGFSSVRPQDPAGSFGDPSEGVPDPWGVRRAEQLLTSLEGVLSCRVVTTPLGEVSEVHVLAQAGLSPKQIVRNVESALLAHLGLKIDHRKISIAQTADVRPIEALEHGAVRDRALHRTVLFDRLAVTPSARPHRTMVAVTLTHAGRTETVEEETADNPRARVEGAARAAVGALERVLERDAIVLEGAKVVDAFDRQVVFAVVQGVGGRDAHLLTGTAEVRDNPERAAVLAVLDATNRWIELRRP